jgi:hypothetical protein
VNRRSRGGQSALIRILHLTGFSFRRAERGVQAVFKLMIEALARGEAVEIPGGVLQCHTVTRRRRVDFSKLSNIYTRERIYGLIRFPGGPRRRIRFRADPRIAFAPLPAPPRPAPPTCHRRSISPNSRTKLVDLVPPSYNLSRACQLAGWPAGNLRLPAFISQSSGAYRSSLPHRSGLAERNCGSPGKCEAIAGLRAKRSTRKTRSYRQQSVGTGGRKGGRRVRQVRDIGDGASVIIRIAFLPPGKMSISMAMGSTAVICPRARRSGPEQRISLLGAE